MIISTPTAYQGGARKVLEVPRKSEGLVTKVGPIYGSNGETIHKVGIDLLQNSQTRLVCHQFSPSKNGVSCTVCGGRLDELEVCGSCLTDHFELRTKL
ncbi:MAG: hypothetical protein WCG01_04970 [bacterium]